MSIYKKLQEARIMLQNTKLNKSGKNKFAGYEYFELGDFLPAIQLICHNMGMCGHITFYTDIAVLTIVDVDDNSQIEFKCPMSSAALKGCHEVQNLGAVQTYLRRYLWTNAFEIVEHDALDATTGGVEPLGKSYPNSSPVTKSVTVNAPPNEAKVTVTKADPKPIAGEKGEWQIVAPGKPEGDKAEWLELVKTASHMLLDLTENEEDVMLIFKKNKSLFDVVKATDPVFFKEMMGKFTEKKNQFTTKE